MEAVLSQLCPCGSALEYSSCCQRYLSGAELAPGPSQLMRSRYSAFVMKDADYLIKTWHPSCQAQTFRAELEKGFSQTEWLGLTLFASDEGRVQMKALSALSPALMTITVRAPLLNVPDS